MQFPNPFETLSGISIGLGSSRDIKKSINLNTPKEEETIVIYISKKLDPELKLLELDIESVLKSNNNVEDLKKVYKLTEDEILFCGVEGSVLNRCGCIDVVK